MKCPTLLASVVATLLLIRTSPLEAYQQTISLPSSPGWFSQIVPDVWRSVPKGELAPVDGYSWFRAMVYVPVEWKEGTVTLFVESLDDARAAYINGTPVGATGTFPPQFRSGLGERGRYSIRTDQLNPGALNTLAIRVYQNDPRPNFSVAPPVLMNETRKEAIRLEGAWQYRPGDDDSWGKATPEMFNVLESDLPSETDAAARGVYLRIDHVNDLERYVMRRNGDTDPLSPAEAEKRFVTPDDLEFQLVLSDPVIAQPLFLTWDERNRLWVMEYRQYPDVAGVRMLSRDTFLRSVYDSVPAAPPNHVRGADRISIHEDTDGDGVYDQHSVFVDGLNIASSFAIGRGGVFVTNPPYLLFYPDADHDGIPDGDPRVLLEGFGLEDSHSVINSMRFGPDGWLYGAQGSTVSAAVKKPGSTDPPIRTLGQQIWRYHPEKEVFEVFAEGGGNTFGCEIDSKGRVFSGHNGGDTRGFHYVQGGYYRKGFGKHGPLSNPFAFGYFENIKHHSVARFTHNFVIYEDDVLPERYHRRLFGIEPLQGQVVMSDVRQYQSSFETEDIERVVRTDDPWFRPVDIKVGPDGCIYVADMYEQRIDHSSHYAGRVDRTTGRVYRLKPQHLRHGLPATAFKDATAAQLITGLENPIRERRQTALRLIGDRADETLLPSFRKLLVTGDGQTQLEALWAIYQSHGFTDEVAITLLKHENQFVRAWTVRLLCDDREVSDPVAESLISLSRTEPYIEVRKQLASSARRLPPEHALPILGALIRFDQDAADIHQPLLLWWALEAQIGPASVDQILHEILADSTSWQLPLVKNVLLARLMKRYAVSGTREDLLQAATLLKGAPDDECVDILLKGFEEAFQGRSLATIPAPLAKAIAATGRGSLALKLRQGQTEAITEALKRISDTNTNSSDRSQLIEILGQTAPAESLRPLLQVVAAEKDDRVLSAAITALQSFHDPEVAVSVVRRFNELSQDARLAAESLLAARPEFATVALNAVDEGRLPADTLSAQTLRKMLMHNDPRIQQLVEKHWGKVSGASSNEMQAEVSRIRQVLDTGSGNPKSGKRLFMQNCGRCHLLFEEGGRIGPDLTPFARDNTERMLINIVNPSLEIREGFENHLVITNDGRILNGFLADKDSQVVILRGVDGQNVVIPQNEIDEMTVVPQSVMPEGSLKLLDNQQLRDLFAYLRSSQPVNY
ncbi:MAG: c-type cytochrome [Planctomycetaceae bacterium]